MRKLIIMGIPHHGNIGDHAIAAAEEEMLCYCFPGDKVSFMSEDYLDVCCKRAQPYIHKEDIILLHGGGNIGDTYARPETGRRKVIELFPDNKIIIFPQTSYFSDTESGKNELEISKRIYNGHQNLTIMAREKKSYYFMKENFRNNKIYLTPDIVMTLQKKSNEERRGALLLFRTDSEKVLQQKDIKQIEQIITYRYTSYSYSDMSLGHLDVHNIGGISRDKLLKNKFYEFQTSQIVITDRLHGMIFAAITETPCVALGNFNHKIEGSYQWLKNLRYIEFCKDIRQIESCIDRVKAVKRPCYDNSFAKDIIAKILKEEIADKTKGEIR